MTRSIRKFPYQPGRRNIGPGQVRRRLRIGLVGAAATLLLFTGLYAAGAPRAARLLVSLPVLLAALGFVQAGAGT